MLRGQPKLVPFLEVSLAQTQPPPSESHQCFVPTPKPPIRPNLEAARRGAEEMCHETLGRRSTDKRRQGRRCHVSMESGESRSPNLFSRFLPLFPPQDHGVITPTPGTDVGTAAACYCSSLHGALVSRPAPAPLPPSPPGRSSSSQLRPLLPLLPSLVLLARMSPVSECSVFHIDLLSLLHG